MGGNGYGLYDIAFDNLSNLYASTGNSLTLLQKNSLSAQSFGIFSGGFPFPTDLEFSGGDFSAFQGGNGQLLVNGGFTDVAGIFMVNPVSVPEPSTYVGLLIGGVFSAGFYRARRK